MIDAGLNIILCKDCTKNPKLPPILIRNGLGQTIRVEAIQTADALYFDIYPKQLEQGVEVQKEGELRFDL